MNTSVVNGPPMGGNSRGRSPGGRGLYPEIIFISSFKTFTNRSHLCLKRTSHEGMKAGRRGENPRGRHC